MQIISDHINLDALSDMAPRFFGDMVKGVVDIDRGLLAVDAELHSDLEAFLLVNGSSQDNLWGVNFYPDITGEDFVEFDSMINIRPSQGNRSRGVENQAIRQRILDIIAMRIAL